MQDKNRKKMFFKFQVIENCKCNMNLTTQNTLRMYFISRCMQIDDHVFNKFKKSCQVNNNLCSLIKGQLQIHENIPSTVKSIFYLHIPINI